MSLYIYIYIYHGDLLDMSRTIGSVLCLTQEEQAMAIEQLDKGNGSVMDSVASSVLNLAWS